MVAVNIKAFRGQIPRISERLLQPNQAKRALNCKLTSGRLGPLNGLGLALTSPRPLIKTMFRYRHVVKDVVSDNWLVFGEDVDVVQSPLANDTLGRFYFASESFEPRMSTYNDAVFGTSYPNAWFGLGFPNPTTAPTVNVTGGVAPTESRAYAYTFVTQFGEESGPAGQRGPAGCRAQCACFCGLGHILAKESADIVCFNSRWCSGVCATVVQE